jgi:hypothetical protein
MVAEKDIAERVSDLEVHLYELTQLYTRLMNHLEAKGYIRGGLK